MCCSSELLSVGDGILTDVGGFEEISRECGCVEVTRLGEGLLLTVFRRGECQVHLYQARHFLRPLEGELIP